MAQHDFISDDDLRTFEVWLRYQALTPASDEEREGWRRVHEDQMQRAAAAPKVGLMKLQPIAGENRYAVALRDGTDLWLTLWVRRSRKGEVFVLLPRGERDWDPHTSYHLDGTLHTKSHGLKILPAQRQPLTGVFHGAEHLGAYFGHGKGSGAVCDPSAFTEVIEVPPGVLGPKHGGVTVDLVEPDQDPTMALPGREIVIRETFKHATPWVVITVWKD
jgi:hypothetical protein